jgi:hypothetical protein
MTQTLSSALGPGLAYRGRLGMERDRQRFGPSNDLVHMHMHVTPLAALAVAFGTNRLITSIGVRPG